MMVPKDKSSNDFDLKPNNHFKSFQNFNNYHNNTIILCNELSFNYSNNIFYDNLNENLNIDNNNEFQKFMKHIEEIKNFDSMNKEDLIKIISVFITNYFNKIIKDSKINLSNLNNNNNINNNLENITNKIANDSTRFSTDSESEYNNLIQIKKNKIKEFFIKTNQKNNLKNYPNYIFENEFTKIFNPNAVISLNEFISKLVKYFNPKYSTFIKTLILVITFIKRSEKRDVKKTLLNTLYFSCFYISSIYDDEENLMENDLLNNLFTLDIIIPFCLKYENIKFINFDIRNTNNNYIRMKKKIKDKYELKTKK